MPAHAQAQVKADYSAIVDDIDVDPGDPAVAGRTWRAMKSVQSGRRYRGTRE
jgi:hypothetical protein